MALVLPVWTIIVLNLVPRASIKEKKRIIAKLKNNRHCEAKPKQSKPMLTKYGYIYLLTNKTNTVIYTDITSDLQKRIYEHKQKLIAGFTKKYNVNKLVYYEIFDDIENAIIREKQIKAGSRKKKIH